MKQRLFRLQVIATQRETIVRAFGQSPRGTPTLISEKRKPSVGALKEAAVEVATETLAEIATGPQ